MRVTKRQERGKIYRLLTMCAHQKMVEVLDLCSSLSMKECEPSVMATKSVAMPLIELSKLNCRQETRQEKRSGPADSQWRGRTFWRGLGRLHSEAGFGSRT